MAGDTTAGLVGMSSVAGTYGGFFRHMLTGYVALRVEGTMDVQGSIRINDLTTHTENLEIKVEIVGQGADRWNRLRFNNGLLVGIDKWIR